MIDASEHLNDDAAALLMLCSRLALNDTIELQVSPLTLKEWNALARKIHESELARPGALLGLSAADLSARLKIGDTEAERVAALLDRGGAIALEMDSCLRAASGA